MVFDYLADDEYKSWQEWDNDTAAQELHIYYYLLTFKHYLKQNGIYR